MTIEERIESMKLAIENAIERRSKLTADNYEVPGLVSLLGRHLYNNLGALATRTLEIGSHLGCSLTSTISGNDNIQHCTAVDSFASDWVEERQCMPIFLENVSKFKPTNTEFEFFHTDAFESPLVRMTKDVDFYVYDGSHDEISQHKAFTYYYPLFADVFMCVIDDTDWVPVLAGTYSGIKEAGLEILFQEILQGDDHSNEGAWNGYGIFLLKKIKPNE